VPAILGGKRDAAPAAAQPSGVASPARSKPGTPAGSSGVAVGKTPPPPARAARPARNDEDGEGESPLSSGASVADKVKDLLSVFKR
jgi:hypothetical protein